MADLQVAAEVAGRGLRVAFGVAAGEVLAVLGPNGAGKSTTAAVIAGLLRADQAVVRVGRRTLTDTDRGLFVPVHDRRVGLLMQDPLLFPHLSVLGNVRFACRRGTGSSAAGWLERVGVAELSGRKPAQLSGGQAQRVALARALAAGPDVLLLDEPLAGLDVAAAARIRADLRDVLTEKGRAALLITHDLLDVVGLADRVMVIEEGAVTDLGATGDVLKAPRSGFGARIAGINVVRGVMDGRAALGSAGHTWYGVPAVPMTPGVDAVAVFSPSAVAVFGERPHGSPRNSTPVQITALEHTGSVVRVHAESAAAGPTLVADVTPDAVAELGLSVGQEVWFTVKTQEVALHAAARPAAVRR